MEVDEAQPDFSREDAVYERHRAALERDHMGKVALVHEEELIGVFETLVEACEEGHRRFGLDRFMIREIGDPVHFIPLGVLPGSGGAD